MERCLDFAPFAVARFCVPLSFAEPSLCCNVAIALSAARRPRCEQGALARRYQHPRLSDERCDSRSPHRRRRRRMRCQLWPMRWDCRSVRQAMQPAMNRGLFCSSARRQRLRQSARRHTDGACDSPCSLVLCAAGRRGQRDRCCRSRCATASSACLGRRGPCPASACASRLPRARNGTSMPSKGTFE